MFSTLWYCYNKSEHTLSLCPALPGPGHRAGVGDLGLVVEAGHENAASRGEAEELTLVQPPALRLTVIPLTHAEIQTLTLSFILHELSWK